jgi:hypothetical protein
VHHTTINALKGKAEGCQLLHESQEALDGFKTYLKSFDGGKRAHKTVTMYSGIVAKILSHECNGNIDEMKFLASWSKPNGILENWCKAKAPSAVQQYMYALKAFLDYIEWCPRKYFPMTGINLGKVKKQISNWIASVKKDVAKQATERVAKTQLELPVLAKQVAAYPSSDHYRLDDYL